MTSYRRQLASWMALLFTSAACIAPAAAAEPTKINFTLSFTIQGTNAYLYWARDKGYFAAEGLDVSIDQGVGSAATVTRIMSGSYQAGDGDMNAVIQAASTRPADAPVMVYMLFNKAPFALIAKADGPIKTLKDVEGLTLGSPAGAAALQLFPALAKKNGVDPDKVKWINMSPQLQEQMMVRGQVAASAVFSNTSYMNLIKMGVDPDKDVRWLFYSDYGLDLYSNGIMVSHKLLTENPKAVAGLVRAANRAQVECAANPDPCLDSLIHEQPLLQKDVERRRFNYSFYGYTLTPETEKIGLGDVDDKRMLSSIDTIVESYGLTRKPTPKEVFDRSFLPPLADRLVKRPK